MNVRFDILAWLLVPLGVTVLALLWFGWRARPKGPGDAHEGVADMARFREAMARPLPDKQGAQRMRRSGRRADGPGQGAA